MFLFQEEQYNIPEVDYVYITSLEELTKELDSVVNKTVVAIDTETTGLNPRTDQIRLVQLAFQGHRVIVVDCFEIDVKAVAETLKPILTGDIKKCGHNIIFDFNFIRTQFGYEMSKPIYDTMKGAYILECGKEERFNLAVVAKRFLGYDLDKYEQKSDWSRKLSESQIKYSAIDAFVTLELRKVQLDEIIKHNLLETTKIEMQCIEAFADLEFYGVPFDIQALKSLEQESHNKSQEMAREFKCQLIEYCQKHNYPLQVNLFGDVDINLGSPAQLLALLNEIGFELASVDQNALKASDYAEHPVIVAYLKWKKAETAKSDAKKYIEHIDPLTERVYPRYRHVRSGRVQTGTPNVQQLPRDCGFRSVVRPRPGYKLAIADWSQIELRIAAQISQDERMLAAYRNNEDLHTLTAALVNHCDISQVKKHQRQAAKALNFGLLYSMAAATLKDYAKTSYGVEMTDSEAAQQHEGFFKAYRGLKQWHDRTRRSVGEAFIRNMSGRRRFIEPKERKLGTYLNTPVQSLGADMLKYTLFLLRDRIAPLGARIILIVHDEIVLETPEENAQLVSEILENSMIEAGNKWLTSLPCVAEAKVADSWADK